MKSAKRQARNLFIPRRGAASIPRLRMTDRAWLAGIVEGEGSIGYSSVPGRGVWRARLEIEMVDQRVVKKCASLMGTSVYIGHSNRGNRNRQTSFMTEAWGERCLHVLRSVSAHFVGSKKKVALKILRIGTSVPISEQRPIIQRRSPEFAACRRSGGPAGI